MAYRQNDRPSYEDVSGLPRRPSGNSYHNQYAHGRRLVSGGGDDGIGDGDTVADYGARQGGNMAGWGMHSAMAGAPNPPNDSSPRNPIQHPSAVMPSYPRDPYDQSPPLAQQGYNPQLYAQAAAPPNPPSYSANVTRAYSTTSHQPYNPAAYRESHVSRHTSMASRPHGFSSGTYMSSSVYGTPPQPYSPASPPFSQQSFPSVRPEIPTLPSQQPPIAHTAPPLARPSAYSPPAPPPVPVPPAHGNIYGQDMTPPTTQSFNGIDRPPYTRSSQSDPLDQRLSSTAGLHSVSRPNGQLEPDNPYPASSAFYIAGDPLPPTAGPVPHQYVPQRMNTTGRHPQDRPLPGPPSESDDESEYINRPNGRISAGDHNEDQIAQENLFAEVEDAVRRTAGGGSQSFSSPRIQVHSFEGSANIQNGGRPNGQLYSSMERPIPEEYIDDSDAEAAAGVAAMRLADEQDAADEDLLFPSSSMRRLSEPRVNGDSGSDDDYGNIDMTSYEGGFGARMSYGGDDPAQLMTGNSASNGDRARSQPVSSSGSVRRSEPASDGGSHDFYAESLHPFPPFTTAARVDTFGTGGLAEPHARRLSYDEGDETPWVENNRIDINEPPEMFYHPGVSQRPLPPPPSDQHPQGLTPAGTYPSDQQELQSSQSLRLSFPLAPEGYQTMVPGPAGTLVPRSTSLVNHSNTPQAVPPIRSKTDAEERRLRQQQSRSATVSNDSGSDEYASPRTSAVAIDLPSIPAGKRFNPSKLTPSDFKRCAEPWALSCVVSWLKQMAEGEVDLKEQVILDGLVALFTYKVPTMNIADAETLSARVVQDMHKAKVFVHEEEWLKFTDQTLTGVLYQLTGTGCYSPKLHDFVQAGRCYSYHCQRTLKKIDLQSQSAQPKSDDWATFYKLKKEDIEKADKKDLERQNVLHEIVVTEEGYMEQLLVLRVVYRDALANTHPPVIAPKRLNNFLRDVFGKLDAVKKANEEYLLPQLKYRQQEQGPFIVGFSDIFREWIRKARAAYIDYASAFPRASLIVRQESERNILFRTFLENARSHRMSNKLGWDTYLKAPITRLQRYSLLLSVVHKQMPQESEEKSNLQTALDEIKAVTKECDSRVAEMNRKVDLTELQSKLVLRPGMQGVELNLDHLGRQLIYQGDLQRTGTNRFTWLDTHALLFDHYLVLAKIIKQRDSAGGTKHERYDVSRLPIPMDLLILESTSDDAVVKSRVAGVARASAAQDNRLGKTTSNPGPTQGTLSHTSTNSSLGTPTTESPKTVTVTNTVIDQSNDNILYPFKVKHLGKDVYTLYAPTAQVRKDWCDKILEAKTKHASSLFAQNAEPFRLRVIADTAFAYEGGSFGQKSIIIKGTPLDRAIREVEDLYANSGRPVPVCRARVNCATAFNQPYGKPMIAIGTDFGVFISDVDNPRGWTRAVPIPRVTQVAVLEEFSLFLLISDKSLIAYHLDIVCPVGGAPPPNDSARRAPQKLSGSRDVGFFATGRMKDRMLVFYKKREGISSTFKVLEPVFQKSTEKKSRFLRSGRTEFFREFDEFYIPTECYGINLFHSSLAVSTSKGFEVLTLDKKQPWSVPDLKESHVASIASRLTGQEPLGMFRLSDQEFLLCYTDCAVYVNKHGDISRSVIMEFVGRARSAALYGPYVLLFDPDFVEIRNAQNGRLRQVIPGRDVKCLDDGLSGGSAGQRTIKVCMQHPEQERCQIVVEMLLNEGQKE